MESLLIRDATSDDYKEVMNLYGIFVEDQKRYIDFNNDSYSRVLNDNNTQLKLAILDDKIVGFILFSIRNVIRYSKPIIEVEEFFVLEEYRRMKIGKVLTDVAFSFAKENDCEYVFLASGKERVPAHKFYHKYGFDEYALHFRKKI